LIRYLRKLVRLAVALACVFGLAQPAYADSGRSGSGRGKSGSGSGNSGPGSGNSGPGNAADRKLDKQLSQRAKNSRGESRVIIELVNGADGDRIVRGVGGVAGRKLKSFQGQVAVVSDRELEKLARHPHVKSVHLDRPTGGLLNRTAVVVGARYVQAIMGYDGSGIGVAVIDSGITSWHDDLSRQGSGQRVTHFVDFVNGQATPYDDNGHGTHVAGVIAGNGYDTYGARAGIAPGANLIGLKVLDARGGGYISNVIAALDYAIAHKAELNIRVVNLSVGAAVTSSYDVDPLTLSAKSAVDAGIVVVVAAGNLGKNAAGQTQYGAITAPGNAPWVLTVGGSNHQGTFARHDDIVGRYSSRGPTAIDFAAKPDLVAPGTGTISLSDPTSTFYATKTQQLVSGTRSTSYKPYLALTGTSMAAPVVAGSVALMLQANPSLTPNAVKAILQYTAEVRPGYDYLTQGAGFLNTRGAVDLAKFFGAARPGERYPTKRAWSRHIFWGNTRVKGGVLMPGANAWGLNVVWGTDADNIVWGTLCGLDRDCDNMVWARDVAVGGLDALLSVADDDNVVWGTLADLDNVVWGTVAEVDNIVWGTDCGGADCADHVWGSSIDGLDGDNVVWGTAEAMAQNVVWGTSGEIDNVVWGTSCEEDNMTWGNSGEDTPLFDDPEATPAEFDSSAWDSLFDPAPPPPSPPPADPIPAADPVIPVIGNGGVL
jgi:serine protease AprX